VKMYLWRMQFQQTCTKGALYIGSDLFCFTLEPPLTFVGRQNVQNKTCVNEGIYPVVQKQSTRFQRVVPVLVNVPQREDIEMHPLNLPSQTDGCIGVGYQWINAPELGDSDKAFLALMGVLTPLFAASADVSLQIESIFEVPHV